MTGYETLQGTTRTGSQQRSTVEVAHEALIQRWPTLRDWVRANRENMRARAAILRAKAEWEESGESEKFLLNLYATGTFDFARLSRWLRENVARDAGE